MCKVVKQWLVCFAFKLFSSHSVSEQKLVCSSHIVKMHITQISGTSIMIYMYFFLKSQTQLCLAEI